MSTLDQSATGASSPNGSSSKSYSTTRSSDTEVTSADGSSTPSNKKNHLVVLIHGLWGSAQNMARLEAVLHESLKNSNTGSIHTFSPTGFSHFKSYDGVVAIGSYIIPELFAHLQKLHEEKNVDIDEISFIGYSFGGIIARYVIGELFEIGFFNTYTPVLFSTFATPHLGSKFYNGESFLNFLGSRFLGRTGKDLFMVEKERGILYKLTELDSKYMNALRSFQDRILVANVKFDRTVGFYSAFITKFDVFKKWTDINTVFISDLPTGILKDNNQLVEPFIVDFQKTKVADLESDVEDIDASRRLRLGIVFSIAFFMFPIFLLVSTFATIRSYLRIRLSSKPNFKNLWAETVAKLRSFADNFSADSNNNQPEERTKSGQKPKQTDDFDEAECLKPHNKITASHITRNIVEGGLNLMDQDNDLQHDSRDANKKKEYVDDSKRAYDIDAEFELEYETRQLAVKKLRDSLVCTDLSDTTVAANLEPVPFDSTREKIFNNLSTIKWTKIGVFFNKMNAHQTIIGRRGFKSSPESIPLLFLYSFLLESVAPKH